jgi:hypothetical protein
MGGDKSPSLPLAYGSPDAGGTAGELSSALAIFEWLAAAGALAATLLMLWANRFPRADFSSGAAGVVVWLIAAVVWAVSVLGLLVHSTRSPRRALPGRSHRMLLLPPLFLLTTYTLLKADLPCRAMFGANRAALTAWAKSAAASPAKYNPNTQWVQTRVGSYAVWHVEILPGGGVQFFIAGSGFFRTTSGYAYCPTTPPPNSYTDTYTPVGNGWYARVYDGG